MSYQWAYPIGHEDLTVDPVIGRTFYQSVNDRDDTTFTDGYEFYLDPAKGGDALYALAPGKGSYSFITLPSGVKIGKVSILVDEDFALELQETQFAQQSTLKRIVYDNIAHDKFVSSLDELIDKRFSQKSLYNKNSILLTKLEASIPAPPATLASALGTTKNAVYTAAKAAFIQAVIEGKNSFLLDAGDKIGNAGPATAPPAGVPSTYHLVKISGQDPLEVDVNVAFFIQALCLSSMGRLSLKGDFTCISDRRRTSVIYTTPLLVKLNVKPVPVLTNIQPTPDTTTTPTTPTTPPTPTPAGTKDIVLADALFDWHTGKATNGMVKWRYNPTDFTFEVKLKDSTKSTMEYVLSYKQKIGPDGKPLFVKNKKGEDTKTKVMEVDKTETVQIRGDDWPSTPVNHAKETWVSRSVKGRTLSASDLKAKKDLIVKIYNANKDILNNIGYYLNIPEEILIAVACHESSIFKLPVRFEPMSSARASLEKEGSLAEFIKRYDLLAPGPKKGGGRKDIAFLDDYSDQTKWTEKIVPYEDKKGNDLSLTWKEYFRVLDLFPRKLIPTKKGEKVRYKPMGPINSRVSPGLAQTVLTTAVEAINYIQGVIDADASIAAKDKNDVLDTPSKLFVWLLKPINSFIAGASYLHKFCKSTGWDIPLVICYYNDGGKLQDIYLQDKRPNPWGYRLNDEPYIYDMALFYNIMRDPVFLKDNNIVFKSRLVRQAK
jgi:hypothetical protein